MRHFLSGQCQRYCRGGWLRPGLSRRQRSVNRSHARVRGIGERAVATLKSWKILTKLRCCPRCATALVQAILFLCQAATDRYSR